MNRKVVRTCIITGTKHNQEDLIRVNIKDDKASLNETEGRGLYVSDQSIKLNHFENKFKGILTSKGVKNAEEVYKEVKDKYG